MVSMLNFLYILRGDDRLCNLFFVLVGVFSVFWYARIYSKSKRAGNPALPPGPPGLPLVGSLPFLSPELHVFFARLARKYGPILKLRLGTKLGIVVTSPDAACEILKDHDLIFANRDVPATARAATYGGFDIVWSPYGPEWRMLRKVCVLKMLSNKTLDSAYALRRCEIRETVRYLFGQAQSGLMANLGEQMFRTTLNVITNMLWGGTVEGDERGRLEGEFRQVVSEITELLGKPNVSDFFPGLAKFDLQGLVKRMHGSVKQLDQIFDRIIDQRLRIEGEGDSQKVESKDFLQFLLKVKDEGDSKTSLTMTNVKALLMDMVVGGSDTSSNTTEFAMAELMSKPEILKKAQQELDQVVGKDRIVEESHIAELPYLRAVMKETLRLHPTLPLLVPHCPTQTSIVSGYTIPKDSRVFVNVWAIHRDPNVWENPLEFNPERFFSIDGDNDNKSWDFGGNDFSYFPFGSGRRICAGIAMAERMVLYSLAALLHSFDWKVPEGKGLDLEEKFGIVLKLKNPLVAVPVARLSDPRLYQLN